MEPITYYTLNQNQHFSFPHDDADTYTDDQLWYHYIRYDYLCVYLMKQLDPAVSVQPMLDTLATLPQFKSLATVWMRLKFVCEVLDPHRILRKRGTFVKRPNTPLTKPPCAAIWDWTLENLTEDYYTIDVVTNIVGLHLFDTVKSLVLNTPLPQIHDDLVTKVSSFSKQLQSLRQSPLDQCQWNRFNPHELVPYPWCMYMIRLKTILAVFSPMPPSS
jgi:hypothetical protein